NQTNLSGNFAVQLNPGAFPATGIKTIGIYATDLSGTKGDIQKITINYQPSSLGLPQPPKTPVLALNAFDDSSNPTHLAGQGQNVTNVNLVRLIGTTDPGVMVALFRVDNGATSGSALGSAKSDSSGSFNIPVGPLADGTYTFLVEATNAFGSTRS